MWLTAIDISDSMARLRNPSDFNGLIFADVLWDKPGFPAYDAFVGRWTSLDPEKFVNFQLLSFSANCLILNSSRLTSSTQKTSYRYPGSGGVHLSWHETFAYTCVQVIAEGYKGVSVQAYIEVCLFVWVCERVNFYV